MKLKFHFDYKPWDDSVAIYLIGEKTNGEKLIAKPMKFEFVELKRYEISEPSFKIEGFESREFLPALANGLAEAGYRHESTDAGELKATKEHLKDMQKLVFSSRMTSCENVAKPDKK